MVMHRRRFLTLLGTGLAATASGIALVEPEPARRFWQVGADLVAPSTSFQRAWDLKMQELARSTREFHVLAAADMHALYGDPSGLAGVARRIEERARGGHDTFAERLELVGMLHREGLVDGEQVARVLASGEPWRPWAPDGTRSVTREGISYESAWDERPRFEPIATNESDQPELVQFRVGESRMPVHIEHYATARITGIKS